MNRIVAVLCVSVLGFGFLLFDSELSPTGVMKSDAQPTEDFSGSPEARKWLRSKKNEAPLAANRFGSTDAALRFVSELYRAGAKRVVVPEDAIEDDGVEVYCDSLVVIMPTDPQQRQRVRAICEREIRGEGFDPAEDREADQVYLWWD